MSRDIWFISDTHFGHSNIIKYCDRPFSSVEEMDEILIQNWNEVVRDQDIIYHLGDVYFGVKGRAVLARLKGRKRLILGNHDNGKDQNLLKHFQKILVWRVFRDEGLLLSHVPVHPVSLHFKNFVGKNVHGHTHNSWVNDEKHTYINVCVENTDYRPVNIESIVAAYE